jgi:hypothetical protein
MANSIAAAPSRERTKRALKRWLRAQDTSSGALCLFRHMIDRPAVTQVMLGVDY